MRISIFLLYVFTGLINGDQDDEQDAHRKRIIEQLTKTRTVLIDDYHLVTRQIATAVYMYRSYRTVSVVFYPVMRDVTEARFVFLSEDVHLNNIGTCTPREVLINIKHGAYPAVNPDGYDFPKYFIKPSEREWIHTVDLLSDGKDVVYTIKNPKPGNWYALIYIKWEDPRTARVEQQGLVPNCQTILYTDLQIKREENIQQIDCYSGVPISYEQLPALFKCMSLDTAQAISLNVNVSNTFSDDRQLYFRVDALSIPTEDNYLVYCAFDPKSNYTPVISFTPHPIAWHYIEIGYVKGNASKLADCESYYLSPDISEDVNHTITDLMRDDKGRFFAFEYGLPGSDLHDATSLINITSSEIKTLRFKINQFLDIGGTLSIAVSLLMNLRYYMGYKREFKKKSLLAFTQDNQFIRAVICMDIGHPSIPLSSGHCKYNDKVRPALFVLNSTDSESIDDQTYVPFPDSGVWYLTFRIFCDEVVCPCRTENNGSTYYVDTSLDKNEAVASEGTDVRVGTSECNATIVLSVSSKPCVNGRCQNYGRCQLNTLNGMVMSYCLCSAGFGGWDCSDDSRMDSRGYMLLSILLLTLSNLLFLLSIYVAIIRFYYTEAMMYGFTMFFSTFYHACDAPLQVAYCMVQGGILQFGDFYCGIMSFWVTLLAMSIIGDKFRSSLQLTGAIVIALLTTWNMHSFISFVAPVAVGAVVLFTSWFLDYRKNRKMKYDRTYYFRYLPLGIILVTVGLCCFGFLQTEQNYKVVHSIWHMIVALSVVFLLPDVRRDGKVNAFKPLPVQFKVSNFQQYFRKQQQPLSMSNNIN